MMTLIIAVIFGLAVALFATQNTNGVNITIAQYAFRDIPLYIIVIASLLLGLFVSWIINLAEGISSALTIHGKNNAINNAQKDLVNLQGRVHELEIENARLKGESTESVIVEKTVEEDVLPRPSMFHRLRHNFG